MQCTAQRHPVFSSMTTDCLYGEHSDHLSYAPASQEDFLKLTPSHTTAAHSLGLLQPSAYGQPCSEAALCPGSHQDRSLPVKNTAEHTL